MNLSNQTAPMEQNISKLFSNMISYMAGDAGRIQHFVKVHAYSRHIGSSEQLDLHTLFILEAAALMHDIGIQEGERLYGRCDEKIQEENSSKEVCQNVYEKIFKTKTGKKIMKEMFNI